mmetsp:Transcript_12539/g.21028  ORF Transcript_12539/g.21028 Transcript_12539/m.21028 type:complete len:396 (+) Transcript_12539:185-1372(+)
MDRWAGQYSQHVAFVCVSCAGPQLASQFVSELRLSHCTVAYIAKQSQMPRWGQLGCNGFIVLDNQLRTVCEQTSAFLEVRERAFRDLESKIAPLLKSSQGSRPDRADLLAGLMDSATNKRSHAAAEDLALGVYEFSWSGGTFEVQFHADGVFWCPKYSAESTWTFDGATVEIDWGKFGNYVLQPQGDQLVGSVRGKSSSWRKASFKREFTPEEVEAVSRFDRKTGGCGPDGCEPRRKPGSNPTSSAASEADTEVGDVVIVPLAPTPSVMVDTLDAEHEACEQALDRLATMRDREALLRLLEVYEAHFAHEEELLDAHVYVGVAQEGGGFSALAGQRRSHYADHERMLAALRERLDSDTAVPSAFVDMVLRDFETHARSYDMTYAEPLAAALVVAQ